MEHPITIEPGNIKCCVGRHQKSLDLYLERYIERGLFMGKKVLLFNPPSDKDYVKYVKRADANRITDVFQNVCDLIKANNSPDVVIINQVENMDTQTNYFDLVKKYRSLQFIADKGLQVIVFGTDLNDEELPVMSTSLCLGVADTVFKFLRPSDKKRKGRIYVRTGPMGADKTSGLVELYNYSIELGFKPFVVRPAKDARSKVIKDRHGNVVPHDRKIDSLLELVDLIATHHPKRGPFIIDESQFLDYDDEIHLKGRNRQRQSLLINQTKILEFCRRINHWLDQGVKIFFYLLDQDFERKAWLTGALLMGKSDRVKKQVAACEWCFRDNVHHSKQIYSGLRGAYQPGESFRACCRHCFPKKTAPLNMATKQLTFAQPKKQKKRNLVLL